MPSGTPASGWTASHHAAERDGQDSGYQPGHVSLPRCRAGRDSRPCPRNRPGTRTWGIRGRRAYPARGCRRARPGRPGPRRGLPAFSRARRSAAACLRLAARLAVAAFRFRRRSAVACLRFRALKYGSAAPAARSSSTAPSSPAARSASAPSSPAGRPTSTPPSSGRHGRLQCRRVQGRHGRLRRFARLVTSAEVRLERQTASGGDTRRRHGCRTVAGHGDPGELGIEPREGIDASLAQAGTALATASGSPSLLSDGPPGEEGGTRNGPG